MRYARRSTPDPVYHLSTNGCRVDHARWERRITQAAELVRRRFLTLREASEHFAVPAEEIVEAC